MKIPFFSIITCTLNSEKYIAKNIRSVNSQTYKNYEVIYIDGKSTDKTISIIKKLCLNTKSKIYFRSVKGISNAFNEGLLRSKGRYIIFLNSDDYFFDQNVLKKVNKYLIKHMDLDWIYGIISVFNENGKMGYFPRYKIFMKPHPYLLKFFNYIPHQAVFMKREVFQKFGFFDENLNTKMDYDYWLRVGDRTKWSFFNCVIANFNVRFEGQTFSKRNKLSNRINQLKIRKRYLNRYEIFLATLLNLIVTFSWMWKTSSFQINREK